MTKEEEFEELLYQHDLDLDTYYLLGSLIYPRKYLSWIESMRFNGDYDSALCYLVDKGLVRYGETKDDCDKVTCLGKALYNKLLKEEP